ncbi:MAG: hypothetical protein ACREJC_14575 [Tepidisphaeraceae bacterium]
MGTITQRGITGWVASLGHQRRALISFEAGPGSLMSELDGLCASGSPPTGLGAQRILEIMQVLRLDPQDVVKRAGLVKSGKLNVPQLYDSL